MAEYHYLMKYKGKYRILPELDTETNDIPRDENGDIDDGYDDIYISCQNGGKIFAYGNKDGNTRVVWLGAYIPSIGRGRNVVRQLSKENIEIDGYKETDEEILFYFMAKDIDVVAKLMKAKTSGADISPFSVKNLPKSDYRIPTGDIERYKAISSSVSKDDLLSIHRVTNSFIVEILQKTLKRRDKEYDYSVDIKTNKMSRQLKEFIHSKGMWDEYLSYLASNLAQN